MVSLVQQAIDPVEGHQSQVRTGDETSKYIFFKQIDRYRDK